MSHRNQIDFSMVVPLSEMRGDSEADTALLKRMSGDAKRFLEGFDWCKKIRSAYFGFGVGGVVAVFLFQILPTTDDIDEHLWVIVGDLPPAYLVTDVSLTAAEALITYIAEMRAWVTAVETGKSVGELIPVNAPPSKNFALALKKRLSYLETSILPMIH